MTVDLDLHAHGDRRARVVIVEVLVNGQRLVAQLDPAEAIALAMRIYLGAKAALSDWRPEFSSGDRP